MNLPVIKQKFLVVLLLLVNTTTNAQFDKEGVPSPTTGSTCTGGSEFLTIYINSQIRGENRSSLNMDGLKFSLLVSTGDRYETQNLEFRIYLVPSLPFDQRIILSRGQIVTKILASDKRKPVDFHIPLSSLTRTLDQLFPSLPQYSIVGRTFEFQVLSTQKNCVISSSVFSVANPFTYRE